MINQVLELLSKRRSFYDINSKLPVDESVANTIIDKCLRLYPSPFNSQSARLIVLYSKQHLKFWKEVEEVLLQNSPKDKAEAIRKRIYSFAKGYGTILFFMDTEIIKNQEKQMPLYAQNFKNWAYQSNAMLQFMIWSVFADMEIGANLQHYNPLIDEKVHQKFEIPKHWELVAQMPFGGIESVPEAHNVENIENKLIILKN